MPYTTPNNAPFDTDDARWLYTDLGQVPIVARSRRTITVDYLGRRLEIKRRELERDGMTTVYGTTFRVSTYIHPESLEQKTA